MPAYSPPQLDERESRRARQGAAVTRISWERLAAAAGLAFVVLYVACGVRKVWSFGLGGRSVLVDQSA